MTQSILALVKIVFEQHAKVTHGGLLIYHALIFIHEANTSQFIQQIGNFIITGIMNPDDENAGRAACGLVSDIAQQMGQALVPYTDDFIRALKEVLTKSEYSTETKLPAMIAIGDICLAIEEHFQSHLDDTMKCLLSACNITISPQNFESQDLINKLRDSIIDAFISIVHGMQPLCMQANDSR